MDNDRDYQELLAAFVEAQTEGRHAEIHDRLLDLERRDWEPQRAMEIQIMLAGAADELGLMDEAQRRLEVARSAEGVTASQRQRVGYYLTMSYVRSRRLDEAEEVLPWFRDQLDEEPRPRALHALCEATIDELRGRHEEALQAFRRAQRLGEAADDAGAVGAAVSGAARVHLCRGDFRLARLALEGLAELLEGDRYHETYNLSVQTFALVGEGRFDEARRLGASTWQTANTLQFPIVAARTALLLAVTEALAGDRQAAHAWLYRASLHVGADDELDAFLEVADAWLEGSPGPPATGTAGELRAALLGEERTWTDGFAAVVAAARRRGARWTLRTDGTCLQSPSGESHDLSGRGAMRRILVALVETTEPLETGDLFTAGWPEVSVVGPNGFRRVYTEIDRLRKLGLQITKSDAGYRLQTDVHPL